MTKGKRCIRCLASSRPLIVTENGPMCAIHVHDLDLGELHKLSKSDLINYIAELRTDIAMRPPVGADQVARVQDSGFVSDDEPPKRTPGTFFC